MNKLFLFLSLVLIALVLPATASADGHSPERPAENQFECGPDKVCEPPTELCDAGDFDYHPHPVQENCIWPEYPCAEPGSSGDDYPKGSNIPDGPGLPHPGACAYPDFPDDHCYVEGGSGEGGSSEGGGSEPGWNEGDDPVEDPTYPPGYEVDDLDYKAVDPRDGDDNRDPGDLVCIDDSVPTTQEKGEAKRRAAARKRAQARKKAAAKRARARRQAARKKAAAKRERLKAKKAAQGRNR